MYANLFNFVVALCIPLTYGSENAINVVLGGSWFSKSSIGTSGNYMLSEWKEKFFNPLITRMAQKVLENMETVKDLHWMILGLVLWNSLLSVIIFYKTLKSFQCRRQNL